MMGWNYGSLKELNELAEQINCHHFVLNNTRIYDSEICPDMPTYQVYEPSLYKPNQLKKYKGSKQDQENQLRIEETIREFKVKQAIKETQKMLAFESPEDKKSFLDLCKKEGLT